MSIEVFGANTGHGHKITIVLEELGIDYDLKIFDLSTKVQKEPWYEKINPNGKVPAIIDHDRNDFILFESNAILHYLADREGKLGGTTPENRWEVLQWSMWHASGLVPYMVQALIFNEILQQKIPVAIERAQAEVRRLFTVMDGQLGRHEYLAGDYSVADIGAWPWVNEHPRTGVSISDYSNVSRWYDAIAARPAVKAGLAAYS